jgi:hypothetical protein
VIRSHYGHGFAKQYVRDDRLLRTEPATNNVYDYGVNKDVENLLRLRDRTSEIIDNYHNVQQDVVETFIDRGQLRQLAEPTVLSNGKRIPGLKLDHPRQLAVMHALVVSPISPRVAGSPPLICTPPRSTHWAEPWRNIRWPRSATTCQSCAPKDEWKGFPSRAAIAWWGRATPFAWPSSNCSRKSMRP